ncbi:MAG: glycosyltransferase family 39 protein [Pyrinomonadaceae bacterium]
MPKKNQIPQIENIDEINAPLNQDERRAFDLPWLLNCSIIVGLAIFMRFYALGMRALHHDEGVNGHFLTTLFRDGVYKYDPANYHGPTLYYIALFFTKIFGLETLPIRGSVAVWGVLIVVLAFYLRRYIGRIGALAAGVFLALSPGMVYISRYFIHEMFFVFLGLGFVIALAFFIEKEKPGPFAVFWIGLLLLVCFFPTTLNIASGVAKENTTLFWALAVAIFAFEAVMISLLIKMILAWKDGRAIYLFIASSCVSLMFATKETAFITLGTMLIACICIWIWPKIYADAKNMVTEFHSNELTFSKFKDALGEGSDRILLIAGAAAIFIYIGVMFFSSFFTYPEGVSKAFEAYSIWSKTGSKDHTQNGMWAYFQWGKEIEAPMMIMAAIGTGFAFLKPRSKVAMFVGLWGFGLLAAYTLIPYKTPWLAISFLLPMCIAAGWAVNEFASLKLSPARNLGILLSAAAVIATAYQSYDLNFVRYDDEDMAYVYAHTKREFLELMKQIDHYAEKSGQGKNAKIQIVSPDYWPMVWYLKDYPNAFFHGKITGADKAEMIVAKTPDQDGDVMRRYSGEYELVGSYGLRSGVDLVLLVRKDLADQ